MDETVYEHESFGKITVCRTQSNGTYLFGSDAKHHHFVHVQVETADMKRNLSHNWIHGHKRLLEFWMTEAQWAQFVSSFGDGTGTPVTLRYVAGKHLELCPPPEQFREQFAEEIKERVTDAVSSLRQVTGRIREALQPNAKPLGKKELGETLKNIEMAIMQVVSNLPYVEKCFNELMDKKMSDAKIEFEAIVARRLQEIGLESLRKSLPESSEPLPALEEPRK